MKIVRKIITTIIAITLVTSLSACQDFATNSKNNIDSYMNDLKTLNSDNYVDWVVENLDNPYQESGLDLSQLRQGLVEYFIKCLSMVDYEIASIDETNKMAEVNVTYVDSTEYVTEVFAEILAYAFSEDYNEEGENQIYLDAMNAIEEYQFVNDTIYFSFDNNGKIEFVSNDIFNVATAGFYKAMLGDPNDYQPKTAKYTAEELLENIEISYEIQDESYISVKVVNNNEVAVYPVINFCFFDNDGNEVIRSQASIEVLPANATSYCYAYNETNNGDVSGFDIETEIGYYDDENITFIDESLITTEFKQEDDMVSIYFTNNSEQVTNICGGYLVYNQEGKVIYTGCISISDLAIGQSERTWFYLPSNYDESSDTYITQSYKKIETYYFAYNNATCTWCN